VTTWGLAGAAYGLVLAFAALTQPIRRRHLAFVASLAFSLASFAAGSLTDAFWVNLLVPGALLLGGYWLSGFYFRDPQPWLETWLLRVDHSLRADRWMVGTPRPILELLEFGYAMDYVVVGGGAIYAATFGTEAVAYYWSLVLASELVSFAPMPWLRSRPPRVAGATHGSPEHESAGAVRGPSIRGPYLRRLNAGILDRASIQANTLPSGHVSGAVAAAFGVIAVDVVVGMGLLVAAGLIAVAAVAGRYHYVVDCISGAVVALTIWLLI
jgi:hypothetical protein